MTDYEKSDFSRDVAEDYIESFSGRRVRFGASPEVLANDIYLGDVAHALSMLCRFNGHTNRFYSVAEHCLLLARYAMDRGMSPLECLTVLHHDDAEYIIGDLARPIKIVMPEFKKMENRIDQAVALRFGTEWPLPGYVKELDARILADERINLMSDSGNSWCSDVLEPLGVKFMGMRGSVPGNLYSDFVALHHILNDRMKSACRR